MSTPMPAQFTTLGSFDETNTLGAAMHLSPSVVRAVLADVPREAFSDERLRTIRDLIAQVVVTGAQADPGSIHAHAITTGAVDTAHLSTFAVILADLYAGVPVPASLSIYARAVMVAWSRRRIAESAPRLSRAAESSPVEDLATAVDLTLTELREAMRVLGGGVIA